MATNTVAIGSTNGNSFTSNERRDENVEPINQTMDNIVSSPALKQYQHQLPADYNPANYAPVQYRQKPADRNSETQRKRRSKNRLSNRRSTGFISKDEIEEASQLGPSSGAP